MAIENTPKKFMDDKEIVAARNCIKARGEYLYLLVTEAQKHGLSDEFARKAIYDWGDSVRKRSLKNPDTNDIPEIMSQLFTEYDRKIWENEVTYTDDEIRVVFNYCPLLAGWQTFSDDPAVLKQMCEIAMEMDVALFSQEGFEYSLEDSKPTGSHKCTMVIKKKVK